jgi:hypothetical protein
VAGTGDEGLPIDLGEHPARPRPSLDLLVLPHVRLARALPPTARHSALRHALTRAATSQATNHHHVRPMPPFREHLKAEAFQRTGEGVDKASAEELLGELEAALAEHIVPLLQKLRLTNFDRNEGQPVVARVKVDPIWDPVLQKKLSKTETTAKAGATFEAQVSGVGPRSEANPVGLTGLTDIFMPRGEVGVVDGQKQGELVVTGRLQPRLYPEHDVYMVRALETIAAALTDDEMSWLKVPLGQVVGPTPQSKGFKARQPLAVSSTSKMAVRWNSRNKSRGGTSSGVNEILPMMQRIVQPRTMHAPLPHFGLSAQTQRLRFEKREEHEEEASGSRKRYVNKGVFIDLQVNSTRPTPFCTKTQSFMR